MFDDRHPLLATRLDDTSIRPNSAVPPLAIPPGHVGEVMLPGTGRLIWWTGRVAIGLRHEPARCHEPMTESALWLQDLMRGTADRPSVR